MSLLLWAARSPARTVSILWIDERGGRASVAVDVEEVSEDVVGAEVVGTDELSDGTSDADVEAPKTVPRVSEEGAVSETGCRNRRRGRFMAFSPPAVAP